jgi:hypothetical protein
MLVVSIMILDSGGWEVNPFVHSVIALYGDEFSVWKFAVVSVSLILLCLYSKFRFVRAVIMGISAIYIGIVFHQLTLFFHP